MSAIRAFLKSHYGLQAGRFLRLFAAALVAQVALLPQIRIGWSVLASTVIGALEVAYREWKPGAVAAVHIHTDPAIVQSIVDAAIAKLPLATVAVTGTGAPAVVVTPAPPAA